MTTSKSAQSNAKNRSVTVPPAKSGLERCAWPGIGDPLYARYHDEEWGVPVGDDRALFEKLILEGFQAGLSWLTILKKRENFRRAFHGFDADRMARYSARDVARLMDDAGIVRNRLKIEAAIGNARAFIDLQQHDSLGALLWGVALQEASNQQRAPQHASDVPGATAASRKMSNLLKRKGFRFVGPTTVYAMMQSTGMVNDHLANCHRRAACAALRKGFSPPV